VQVPVAAGTAGGGAGAGPVVATAVAVMPDSPPVGSDGGAGAAGGAAAAGGGGGAVAGGGAAAVTIATPLVLTNFGEMVLPDTSEDRLRVAASYASTIKCMCLIDGMMNAIWTFAGAAQINIH